MQCSIILTYTDIVIESYHIFLGLHTNKVTQIAMLINHIWLSGTEIISTTNN